MRTPSLTAILTDADHAPLTVGRETATELGLAALEHLEQVPSQESVRSLVTYAARHDESSPARDALVAVLLNASETLNAALAAFARDEVRQADWGAGRESPALNRDPQVTAVPRRQALAERLLAERARRLRPEMQAYVQEILRNGPNVRAVPSCFLERNWIDLRDTLTQRARSEPMHREAIAAWVAAQHPAVRTWLQPVEDILVDVATTSILETPLRAPVIPYCGAVRVAERIRTAVAFRGEPARVRLTGYLERVTPGTAWYETIRGILGVPAARER